MKLEPITGIDKFRHLVGEILKHPGDKDRRDYRVSEFIENPRPCIILEYRNNGETMWKSLGTYNNPANLCTVILPYDPTQQGDTDDDI